MQRRVLPLVEAAFETGEGSGSNFTHLSDRVAVGQGRVQLYGTQFDVKGEGRFEFARMDDRAAVDARRKTVGLPTLAVCESAFRA